MGRLTFKDGINIFAILYLILNILYGAGLCILFLYSINGYNEVLFLTQWTILAIFCMVVLLMALIKRFFNGEKN